MGLGKRNNNFKEALARQVLFWKTLPFPIIVDALLKTTIF